MTRRAMAAFTIVILCAFVSIRGDDKPAGAPTDWNMKATIIEACSCPMFCQCYFNEEPAGEAKSDAHAGHAGHEGHGGQHFCKFNNAYKVDRGFYGATNLEGAKFWVAGDLGGDFSKGQMEWAVLHFDPSVSKEQREGIKEILGKVYPVKWGSFTVGDDKPIEWTAGKDQAVAKLDGGKAAEVVLKRQEGNTSDPVVIKNLKYWGTPRNDGFVLMKNDVEALHEAPAGKEPFEFKGTNGFMITFDMSSKDAAGK
jgi:hypothetical protein